MMSNLPSVKRSFHSIYLYLSFHEVYNSAASSSTSFLSVSLEPSRHNSSLLQIPQPSRFRHLSGISKPASQTAAILSPEAVAIHFPLFQQPHPPYHRNRTAQHPVPAPHIPAMLTQVRPSIHSSLPCLALPSFIHSFSQHPPYPLSTPFPHRQSKTPVGVAIAQSSPSPLLSLLFAEFPFTQ